jgi:2-succinyl-6-hydroxy-2,4-cyclohexadiene-1-carboxylate synthase
VLKRLNGLNFNVEIEGSGPPLLLLHGFTGSTRSWDDIRPELIDIAQVIAIDLIGHGHSECPADVARYTLEWCASDLLALLDWLDIAQTDLLGYSMGGRAALQFAVQSPQRVRRLVLESASPGIEAATERARRVDSDNALAQRILIDGIEAFVDEWELVPLLVPAPHVSAVVRAQQHTLRLHNNARGLANSLRGMGAGQQVPLWNRLSELRMPVQLIVGARDSRYLTIAERMHGLLPEGAIAIVPEAGHTVHVDQPRHFTRQLKTALLTTN